jgi:hypothetical protein
MKIILKKDWDIPINAPVEKEQRGYFVGRKTELRLLVNEILRRDSGAILVSGYRGVGKTSLAYKALWEVKSYDKNNINNIIVLLNASQLEAEIDEKNQKIRPRAIIENLIRRLYSVTKDSDLNEEIKEKINKLYRKTVAEEFKLIESYQKVREQGQEVIQEEINELFLSEKNIRTVFYLICWIIAFILQFIPIDTKYILLNQFLNEALPLLLMFPIPFGINLLYRTSKKKRQIAKSQIATEELYQFDDNIGNLEFDLEDIHRNIKQDKKKLIYIIDELDKLETSQVMDVLKFFKNLFTISDAIFVFVGNEDIFKIGLDITEEEKRQEIYRSKAYTYFTSRYFLSRPLWNDLKEFFDEIIEQKDIEDKNLEILERAIAFDAKNDFFDLKNFIKDRITGFSNDDNPIIEIDKLDSKDIQKARFQKSITALFEDKYISHNPSKWEENERILRILFDQAHKVYDSYSGTQFSDTSGDKIEDEAIRDFNNFLWRNGAFSFQNENPQTIKGVQISIRNYSYTGSIPKDPPDSFSLPTEIEIRFVKIFKDYSSYILALNNVFQKIKGEKEASNEEFWENPTKYGQQINNWGFDALSVFNNNHYIYYNIVKKEFSSHKREEIEQRINQLSNHIKSMIQNLPIIISQMLISLNQNKNLQNQRLQDNAYLFGSSANEIRNALMSNNPHVVFNSDLSRQILLIFNQLDTLLSIKKHIRDNAGTHRIGCVVEDSVNERIRGLYFINAKSSEALKQSLISFIRTINRFLEK